MSQRFESSLGSHNDRRSFVTFVSNQGLYNEVVGPTMPDLKNRVGADYEEMGRILLARSAGLLIGSVLGGLVYDQFPWQRDIIIATALLVSALTTAVAPWCTAVWQLGIVFHLMGHSHAFLTTGNCDCQSPI